MKAGLLIRYTCLGCHLDYYVDFIYDGKNDYFCPHCGKKKMNVGRSYASDVEFADAEMDEWECPFNSLFHLKEYLTEHYPDGIGEDIFFDFEQCTLHEKNLDTINTYEDEKLEQLMKNAYNEIMKIKKEC